MFLGAPKKLVLNGQPLAHPFGDQGPELGLLGAELLLQDLMKKHQPAGQKLLIKAGEEMFYDGVVLREHIGFSAEFDPPKMSESCNMFGPVVHGLKGNLQEGILLHPVIEGVDNAGDVGVGKLNAIDADPFFHAGD